MSKEIKRKRVKLTEKDFKGRLELDEGIYDIKKPVKITHSIIVKGKIEEIKKRNKT
jgi:hypothetical protein